LHVEKLSIVRDSTASGKATYWRGHIRAFLIAEISNIHKRILALQVAETFSAEQASEAHKKLESGGTHGRCVIML
jgi:hypothetical protein